MVDTKAMARPHFSRLPAPRPASLRLSDRCFAAALGGALIGAVGTLSSVGALESLGGALVVAGLAAGGVAGLLAPRGDAG